MTLRLICVIRMDTISPSLRFPPSTIPNKPSDVGVLLSLMKLVMALRNSPVTASDELQLAFRVPSFDHSIQDPVHNDICVSSSDRIVILEGNYLLLDEEPWNVVAKLVDERYVELTQIHLQLCSPAPL
jgi:pantothenate kinase